MGIKIILSEMVRHINDISESADKVRDTNFQDFQNTIADGLDDVAAALHELVSVIEDAEIVE